MAARNAAMQLRILTIAVGVLVASGCAAPGAMAVEAEQSEAAPGFDGRGLFDLGAGGWSEPAEPATTTAAQAGERMLVQQGAIKVEVARVDEARASFLAMVRDFGGHLSLQQGNACTVRLPAAQFEAAFAALRRLGRVLDEQRQASDVTEEYLDLGIRLDNARRSRERLLALLERADKVEDVLKIEEQLRRLTEEIERLEGRRRFLADQVAMATLTATFVPVTQQGRPPAAPSRFDWIRDAGAEPLLGRW